MRLLSEWNPRLADGHGSPCDRLVGALAGDILEGRLKAGDRLPAHRDLSWRLGIGLGTVTKAYGILERRGLVRSVKGRGTFVAAARARPGPVIDLSRNVPPAAIGDALLARTLAAVARRIDADLYNGYPPTAGHDEYRRQMAGWYKHLGMDADPARLLLTNGAQHALSVAMSVACGPGGTLVTEEETYPGAIGAARSGGVRLAGVAMDAEGMRPDDLDRVLSIRRDGPVAVYVTPTMQNPTTSSMGRARRGDIVAVCRAHGVPVIEDDVYTLRRDTDAPPLAALAPDQVLYVNSLSKTLNPALRIGGLVVPAALYARAEACLQATTVTVSPLVCTVMEQWLLDGTADAVMNAILSESRRRRDLVRSILGDAARCGVHDGYHVWLPLPGGGAERLDMAARALGVQVTPPASTSVDGTGAAGVRLCVGAPPLPDLINALRIVASILERLHAGTEVAGSAVG